jgi:hypothetical protein
MFKELIKRHVKFGMASGISHEGIVLEVFEKEGYLVIEKSTGKVCRLNMAFIESVNPIIVRTRADS